MMGTGSGANWINGVHSTCGAGKLTGSIDNLISPGRRCPVAYTHLTLPPTPNARLLVCAGLFTKQPRPPSQNTKKHKAKKNTANA
ncbi:hypothetical protein C4869_19230 [Salmonella enterica subsp. enterica serovar Anatum]|nr:hypothetical protein C4869_19230 [Salmonella enterica subsp. enterica serovar Anatum]